MTRVLVVDDEIGVRELVREVLEDTGYRVSTASNAAEANWNLKSTRPDVVLLDLSLPDVDGLSLIRSWSSSGRLPVPVVVLTGFATIDNAVEATRMGASDFLEKPLSLQKLLASVHRALSGGALPSTFLRPAAPPESAAASGDSASPEWPPSVLALPYREARLEFERAYFLNALARDGGRHTEVAARTGLERTHLYRKIRALGLRSSPRRK